ncbi:UdgX family uracil-DNA binding protein [Paraburkholderia sp. DHOC27]|uniref:UdgX family uracil-DNA binding protein n=1 Tax=Paraburkholderia sp. DHOC27 TaxID=2303330 RepID=UPI000E3ECF66|nr:UdgX family uracil-DNA binding protein [Paraburkholderia sp. DHOC27]RFU44495.1 uracil-DNA glycosylase [Paraburkholderia sp. DHOC27]
MSPRKHDPPESDSDEKPTVIPLQEPVTLEACRRCSLWHDATQPVGGLGPKHAPIMMVGEQPGDQEDLQGKPFVGPAGRMLDTALEEADVAREDVYVTNAVKHFKWTPRGKRRMHKTPAQREIDACHYWLARELAEVQPRVLVALGATALKALLADKNLRLSDALGKTFERDGRVVIATWHPSYGLRARDASTRERVYADIVDALRRAGDAARSNTSSTRGKKRP